MASRPAVDSESGQNHLELSERRDGTAENWRRSSWCHRELEKILLVSPMMYESLRLTSPMIHESLRLTSPKMALSPAVHESVSVKLRIRSGTLKDSRCHIKDYWRRTSWCIKDYQSTFSVSPSRRHARGEEPHKQRAGDEGDQLHHRPARASTLHLVLGN